MITNYFTLEGLIREWRPWLEKTRLEDAYSYLKDEISLVFSDGQRSVALRISVTPGFHFIYSQPRPGRPKTNVTTLFEKWLGKKVHSAGIVSGDRILQFEVGDNHLLECHLYGPRANLLMLERSGDDYIIVEAFKHGDDLTGNTRATPTASDPVKSVEQLDERLLEFEGSVRKALRRTIVQLGSELVDEVLFRAQVDNDHVPAIPDAALTELKQTTSTVLDELRDPTPAIYNRDDGLLFSPIQLESEPALDTIFDTVDEAARTYVKRAAHRRRLTEQRDPLLKALERALDRAERKVEGLNRARDSESRADEYERWGHLLMAQPGVTPLETETLTVPDLLASGDPVEIPVDPELTSVQNAERYYDRARKIREDRRHFAQRLEDATEEAALARRLLDTLGGITDLDRLKTFEKEESDTLSSLVGGRAKGIESKPFRRFSLRHGFEAWAGRNARENDELTFAHASRHDRWFHARDVPGSHVVLRVHHRDAEVPRTVMEQAASIAAWFSSARGSNLVPVQTTLRKYVTKPRGGGAGTVRLSQEDVLLVKPGLPEEQ